MSQFVSTFFPKEREFVYPRKNLFICYVPEKKWLRVPVNSFEMQKVENLKEFARKELKIEGEFHIYFGKVVLDDNDAKLDRFLLHNKLWTIQTPKSKTPSSTRSLRFKFTSMESGGLQTIKFTSDAPKWRMAGKGLCVEGPCENTKCEAYFPKAESLVIMSMGFGEFDMLYDRQKCKCPLCNEQVKPQTCAFNNCKWSFTGMKGTAAGTPVEGQWREADNNYYRFSDVESDQVEWSRLVLYTKDLSAAAEEAAICNLCIEDFSMGKRRQTRCGHLFHEHCLEDWKTGSMHCPSCRESLVSTAANLK